jgi:hypothetical protein
MFALPHFRAESCRVFFSLTDKQPHAPPVASFLVCKYKICSVALQKYIASVLEKLSSRAVASNCTAILVLGGRQCRAIVEQLSFAAQFTSDLQGRTYQVDQSACSSSGSMAMLLSITSTFSFSKADTLVAAQRTETADAEEAAKC